MKPDDAIYDILVADSNVNTAVGTRVYLVEAPQDETLPFIVYRTEKEDETHTKSGVSNLDTYRIEVDAYVADFGTNTNLPTDIRTALDGYQGTINSVVVQGSKNIQIEPSKDIDGNALWSLDFLMRIIP